MAFQSNGAARTRPPAESGPADGGVLTGGADPAAPSPPSLPRDRPAQAPILRRAGGDGTEAGTGLAPNTRLPAHLKGFRLGYPLGGSIPVRNDSSTEQLLDYCYRMGLGTYEWNKHLRLMGTARAQSVRIDDNRNLLCTMHLERSEVDGAEVLVMLDRDMVFPPDGVAQLALTCRPDLPIVSGVYFQRQLRDPYPHVYRYGTKGANKYGEPSVQSDKLVREIWEAVRRLGVPEHIYRHETSVRFAAPDGAPLPESERLLVDPWGKGRPAFGGTGFTAIHNSVLLAMKEAGAPYFPWFRDRGEKGDMAFFLKAQELGFKTAVDLSVYAGHLTEELVGLPQFMEVFGPACALVDAHLERTAIDRVAVVVPTLHPDRAGALLERVRATAGVPVLGVVVADYARRGGTKTLNDGIAAALSTGAPAVLLLDDDVDFPEEGWLRRLCDALEAPHVGAVGPTIPCRGPQSPDKAATAGATVDPDDMPFLCGAAMLYKRAALMDVGALDERMRHYASDTDHGLLLRNHQWRLVWVRDVRLDHQIAATGYYPEQWSADHAVLEQKWNLQPGASTTGPRADLARGERTGVAVPGLPVPRAQDPVPLGEATAERPFVGVGV